MRLLGRPTPRYALVVLAGTLGATIGFGIALWHGSRAPAAPSEAPQPISAQVTWKPGAQAAPDFALRDENGSAVSLAAWRGRPVVVTFLDSRCTRECPLEGRVLADVLRRLRGTDAVLAVVSVDPWSDTAASARAFARRAGWSGDWHWLLGPRSSLAPVWRAFHVGVQRTPGDVLHSAALYVVDRSGHLRSGFLFPFSAASVAADVRRLS